VYNPEDEIEIVQLFNYVYLIKPCAGSNTDVSSMYFS